MKNDRGRQLTPTSDLLTLACACVHTQTWTDTNTHTHGEKLCHSETIIAQEESENTYTLVTHFVLSFTPRGGSPKRTALFPCYTCENLRLKKITQII